MAGLMIRWFICRFITMRRERHGRLIGSQPPKVLSSCNIYSVTTLTCGNAAALLQHS